MCSSIDVPSMLLSVTVCLVPLVAVMMWAGIKAAILHRFFLLRTIWANGGQLLILVKLICPIVIILLTSEIMLFNVVLLFAHWFISLFAGDWWWRAGVSVVVSPLVSFAVSWEWVYFSVCVPCMLGDFGWLLYFGGTPPCTSHCPLTRLQALVCFWVNDKKDCF